jgi:hypothetical protein
MNPGFMGYCRNRMFEWVMTLAMLGIALEIAIWPSSIASGSFRLLLVVISPAELALFFGTFGLLRIAALIANGSWPEHGPRMRAMGAGAAALMWGQMCIALMLLTPDLGGVPSAGIPVYFSLTVGELISAYRAISDARPG